MQNRGIEVLDYNTFIVRLGGLGGNPKDLGHQGQQDAVRSAFRGRVPASTDKTVFRAGYGKTFDPLPWSRPMRGRSTR